MAASNASASTLGGLAAELRRADGFEAAAVASLGALLDVAAAAVAKSAHSEGRVVRAMLHLRPHDAYEGLYVLEAGARALTDVQDSRALLPSASVWRWIEAGKGPVAVDVEVGLITPHASEPEPVTFGPHDDEPVVSDKSRTRLLQRGATHIYVLPLATPGGLAGMVSIEAECASAMGSPFVWEACAGELEALVWLAAPHLAALPRPPAPAATEVDDLLPVVGPTMASLVHILRAFAAEEETLLLRGETGTGKSRLARWVHTHSPRSAGPFELLDLNTVPEQTQMGELFGWKKGAFTGAVSDHAGFVRRSEGGTLFIDEIDKLSLRAQAALLTLLEERRYRVLGEAGESRRADVRFVVGTNADLPALVAAGRFREDLYYRINVLPMALPPLRERLDEVSGWAEYMLSRRHAEKGESTPVTLSPEAKASLQLRSWPGNLRELDNMMRRAYTLAAIDGAGRGVEVTDRHLQLAERLEGGEAPKGRSALGLLREASRRLVQGLMTADPALDLSEVDLPGALHGILLGEAVQLTKDREAAFRLLGRGELVKNRNHHKALRRDWSRALALYEALSEDVPEETRAEVESSPK